MREMLWSHAARMMTYGGVFAGLVWLCAVLAVFAAGVTLSAPLMTMIVAGGVFCSLLLLAGVMFSAKAKAAGEALADGAKFSIDLRPERLGPAALVASTLAGVGWAMATGTGAIAWLAVGLIAGGGVGGLLLLAKRTAD
jgi:hypothetical protein